ncbi:RICIN domain-containing protein [Winogradskya consettensis]|uniref:RICIN domain-containing protein n=1 Tax=Winogradskya consettensis TaxID=113560 RepID=UPI001BB335D9|nr:RICIN domain-containing protein [Actinoplanes consettensis]
MLLGAGLALACVLAAGGFVARQAAGATPPLAGARLSAPDLRIVVSASASCPALTPARLAGQVMAASGFGIRPVTGMRAGGRTGVAALTPAQWQQNKPWPDADPADREAGITALAHLTCQEIGKVRAARTAGDPWRLALAAQHVDGDYVETVERYAAWYALQPVLERRAVPPVPAIAVPEQDVAAVVTAGSVCPDLSPARIAAQIMATSGFDAAKVGATGEQGIAQFLPQVWAANAGEQDSPWTPSVAIPVLGRTMCKLMQDAGGQYGPALAAFTGGTGAMAAALLDDVTTAEKEYAKDKRLSAPASPAPVETETLRPIAPAPATTAPATTAPATTGPVTTSPGQQDQQAGGTQGDQPAVKDVDGGPGGDFGPYHVRNLTTRDCIAVPGNGTRDGPVIQIGCSNADDWTFEPRGTDGDGYELYWIRNAQDHFCVDPPGAGKVASSTSLNETGCSDKDNQFFRLEPQVAVAGTQYYWLRDAAADMCVDVPGAGTGGAGARLALVPCKSGDDHEWALLEKAQW